jgi:hypothetical protein
MSKRNRRPAAEQLTPAGSVEIQEDGGEGAPAIEAGDAMPEASELREHPGTGTPPQMVGSAIVSPGETGTMTLHEPDDHGEAHFAALAAQARTLASMKQQDQLGAFEPREIPKLNLQFTDEEHTVGAKIHAAMIAATLQLGGGTEAPSFAEEPTLTQELFALTARHFVAETITPAPHGLVWCTSTETLAIRGAVGEQGRTVDRIRPGVRVLLPEDRFLANAKYLKRV